jgi:RDD family
MTLEPKGHPNEQPSRGPEITLARWSTRFWAWLVDFIIITVATEIIFAIAYATLAFNQGIQDNPALGAVKYAVQSLLFFGYWLYFESTSGQSIGKKLLKIKTTGLEICQVQKMLLYRALQSIPTANRCALRLDIYKRKEAEAFQQSKRYYSDKDTIVSWKDSQRCQVYQEE